MATARDGRVVDSRAAGRVEGWRVGRAVTLWGELPRPAAVVVLPHEQASSADSVQLETCDAQC